ncbi:MAG: FHA domain-containing protein [Myxococcota bacterium]
MDPVAVEEFELIREAPADHAGVRIPLCGLGDRLVVGRSSTADVLLLSARAAREHARLRRHGDGWTLEAVSGHGVRVNARIVEGPERLVPGSRIELGDDVLLFERPTDAVEPGDAPARGPWIALVLGVAVLVGLAVAIWSRG